MLTHPFYPLKQIEFVGPLLDGDEYRDNKDPNPVFDGKLWHIYGSGGSSVVEIWKILHAVAPSPEGPWEMLPAAILDGLYGPHVAAPSVMYDFTDNLFHMFVQQDFTALEVCIEHLVSEDGHYFKLVDEPLSPMANTDEAGLYDPHAAAFGPTGEHKFITYSGIREVGRPDLFIAESQTTSWSGPWQRKGPILRHEQVPFHNPRNHPDYEWGLEGSQIIELPGGISLLVAVCFLPEGERGTRQRVFISTARGPLDPYYPIAPILEPGRIGAWQTAENGHAAGIVSGDELLLFYQGLTKTEGSDEKVWRYGLAKIAMPELLGLCQRVLASVEEVPA